MKASQSMEHLPSFNFLTQMPLETVIQETVGKKHSFENQRAQSVLTHRVQSAIERQTQALIKRKKLDKILHSKQAFLKDRLNSDFQQKSKARQEEILSRKVKAPRMQELESQRSLRNWKDKDEQQKRRADQVKE